MGAKAPPFFFFFFFFFFFPPPPLNDRGAQRKGKGSTRFTTPRPSATAISTSSSTNAISKCARQGSKLPDGRVVSDRARLGRKALGLYAAVRGADPGYVPSDAVRRRCPAGLARAGTGSRPSASAMWELALAKADLSKLTMLPSTRLRAGAAQLLDVRRRCRSAQKWSSLRKAATPKTIAGFSEFLSAHKGTPEQNRQRQHRYVEGLHQGRDEASAQRPHNLRQVPCRCPRLQGRGPNPPCRAEDRSSLKGLRWALAQGPPASPGKPARGPRCICRAGYHQAHRPRLALPRAAARHSRPQNRSMFVSAMLKRWCSNVKRSKVEAMKKGCPDDPRPLRGRYRLGSDPPDKRLLEAINGLFRPPSARPEVTAGSKPCAPSSSSSPETSTSQPSIPHAKA